MVPTPFTYPFRGERPVDVLLIGGGLHLAAVWIPVVPLIAVLGYLLSVLDATARLERTEDLAELPGFRPVRPLVRHGLAGTVIVLTYLIPATVTLLVTVAVTSGRSFSPDTIDFGTSMGFVLGSTTALLLAIVFVYLLPAALIGYLESDRLRGAFDPGLLAAAATDGGYFYNVTVGIIAGALVGTLAGATLGIAVGFFLAFYGELVVIGYWSRAGSRVLGYCSG